MRGGEIMLDIVNNRRYRLINNAKEALTMNAISGRWYYYYGYFYFAPRPPVVR